MSSPNGIPQELQRGPFSIREAEAVGVSRSQLRSPRWRRVTRGAYVWSQLSDDPAHRLIALARHLPSGCAFSGATAALILGLDCPAANSGVAEATGPRGIVLPERRDLRFHRSELATTDVVARRGLPVTSPTRTAFDLARRLPLPEALAVVDGALHRRLLTLVEYERYVADRPGWQGVARARLVRQLAEPASESPMESRLRLVLIQGGLPKPEVQVSIHDRRGLFAGRLDLYYRQACLGVEYDGTLHRDSLAADARRQNRLLMAGVRLLRYTAADVLNRPEEIVEEVRLQMAGPCAP